MKIRDLNNYFFGTKNYKFHKKNKNYFFAIESIINKTSLTILSGTGLVLLLSTFFDNPQQPMKYIVGFGSMICVESIRPYFHKLMKKEIK